VRVDALVALETHECDVERGRERLGDLGLPDAGFALEQQRLPEREREEDRGGEPAVGEVRLLAETRGQLLDRLRARR
jgi:hypothetical protein